MNRNLPHSFERLRCPGGWDLVWRGKWRHFHPGGRDICQHGVPYTKTPGAPYSAAWPRTIEQERTVNVP